MQCQFTCITFMCINTCPICVVPAPPVDLAVTVVSSRSVDLSWSAPPERIRNGLVLYFVVTIIQVSPPTENQPIDLETPNMELTVHSLHPAWSYEFAVSAVTSAGIGESTVVLGTLLEDGK